MLKQLIFSFIGSFMFIGCVNTPSLMGYTQNILSMQVNNNKVILHTKVVNKKLTNFVSLGLYQYTMLLANKELIVYENARTDISYEFEPSIHRIIKIVFDAKALISIYGEAHLYAYQVVLANNYILNLIAYQGDTQHLQMIYGMSTKTFNQMIHSLNPNTKIATYNSAITINKLKNPYISKWNDNKVHFVPLVVPLARFMGPF